MQFKAHSKWFMNTLGLDTSQSKGGECVEKGVQR